MNPYFNPYQQYPYTQSQQNQVNQQTQQHYYQPQPQIQTNYLPLTFVNGIEGAKAFIVGANQIVYLKDSDSNILYEKKADYQGKYTLTAYELKPIEINNIGKPISSEKNYELITKNDLVELESTFTSKINILSQQIEKLIQAKPGIEVIKESE